MISYYRLKTQWGIEEEECQEEIEWRGAVRGTEIMIMTGVVGEARIAIATFPSTGGGGRESPTGTAVEGETPGGWILAGPGTSTGLSRRGVGAGTSTDLRERRRDLRGDGAGTSTDLRERRRD